ncbi:unnamed protein product, partial [Ixodes hexagonus]
RPSRRTSSPTRSAYRPSWPWHASSRPKGTTTWTASTPGGTTSCVSGTTCWNCCAPAARASRAA